MAILTCRLQDNEGPLIVQKILRCLLLRAVTAHNLPRIRPPSVFIIRQRMIGKDLERAASRFNAVAKVNVSNATI